MSWIGDSGQATYTAAKRRREQEAWRRTQVKTAAVILRRARDWNDLLLLLEACELTERDLALAVAWLRRRAEETVKTGAVRTA